jgi:hypothetical protein
VRRNCSSEARIGRVPSLLHWAVRHKETTWEIEGRKEEKEERKN